jgi:hypothetical protein
MSQTLTSGAFGGFLSVVTVLGIHRAIDHDLGPAPMIPGDVARYMNPLLARNITFHVVVQSFSQKPPTTWYWECSFTPSTIVVGLILQLDNIQDEVDRLRKPHLPQQP